MVKKKQSLTFFFSFFFYLYLGQTTPNAAPVASAYLCDVLIER